MVHKWLLPSLSEVLAQSNENWAEDAFLPAKTRTARERVKGEREWSGAIAALEVLLRSAIAPGNKRNLDQPIPQGVILAGPTPLFSDKSVNSHFPTWTFTTQLTNPWTSIPFQLPPAKEGNGHTNDYGNSLGLAPTDPLAAEQFCLVLTTNFSLVMVLGEDHRGIPAFMYSFAPEVVQQAWATLRSRVLLSCPHHICQLDMFAGQFSPTPPDYRTVMEFSRLLLKYMPDEEIEHGASHKRHQDPQEISHSRFPIPDSPSNDVELLQAFAHEVRTPLTTIRTLTRLLLKRKDLAPDIIKRLEIIDRECSEQIDRMELLFQAAELEISPKESSTVHLTPVSLAQVFQHSLPRWEKQANRRNLTLDVVLPQQMPQVVSDPTMLDRILTGLIENFTRNLPAGSHIQVEVIPAGNQLKLQLQTHTGSVAPECQMEKISPNTDHQPTRKLIGQLLMFEPETGSISLNHSVTKNLFQALGGKLIVRQRPQQGEVLTIYLPLESNHPEIIRF